MNRGTQLTLGDTGRPENRVVRIVNLHYEADRNDIRKFFGDDFTIVDFIRGVNSKTNKNTVGYALFATEQERINAQALSGCQILNREVQVLPAQSGFRISPSGDKLLPPSGGKNAATNNTDEMPDALPPAVGDVDAFPSLGMTATPRLGAPAPVQDTPTRKQPAQQRALQNRLLFMNNVGQGPEVNETSFRLFFGRYTVVDVKRPLDPRTNTPNPTAFVMLASAEERDGALHHLKDVPMQGRKLTMEVPKTFQTVDEQGFLPSPAENVFTFSSRQRGIVASNTPNTTASTNVLAREGLPHTPPKFFEKPSASPFSPTDNSDFQVLLGQLGMEDNRAQQAPSKTRIQREQEAKATRQAEDERQARHNELRWRLSREELRNRYLSQQRTLLSMPSGVECPGQIVIGPPMTPPVGVSSPFARSLGPAPRGPPPGIDTSFRPREYSWGLSGNQDPAHHIISEEAWYGGLPALQQRKGKQKGVGSTTAQRIMTEGDIIEDGEKGSKKGSE